MRAAVGTLIYIEPCLFIELTLSICGKIISKHNNNQRTHFNERNRKRKTEKSAYVTHVEEKNNFSKIFTI